MNNISKFCRFCAVENSNVRDLTSYPELLENVKQILKALEIKFVDLSDNSLPSSICIACYRNLRNCHHVFSRVKSSQNVLRDVIAGREEPKKENVEDSSNEETGPNPENNVPQEAAGTSSTTSTTWASYPIICVTCTTSFKNFVDLVWHCHYTHRGFIGYQCDDCRAVIPSFMKFVSHVFRHRPELIHFCPICDIRTDNQSHIMTHMNMFGDQAEFVTPNSPAAEIVRPLNVAAPINVTRTNIQGWQQYPWICQLCNQRFQDQVPLRAHLKAVHQKCFGFRCIDCPAVLRCFDNFVKHVTVHRPNLRSRCEYCDAPLLSNIDYMTHINRHRLPYKCTTCGEFFYDESRKLSHDHLYNRTNGVIALQIPRIRQYTLEDLACEECERVSLGLRQHLARAGRFKCNLCDETFDLKVDLNDHLLMHPPRHTFKCETCNKYFRTIETLQAHMKVHSDEKQGLGHFSNTLTHDNTSTNQANPPQNLEMPSTSANTEQLPKNDLTLLEDWTEEILKSEIMASKAQSGEEVTKTKEDDNEAETSTKRDRNKKKRRPRYGWSKKKGGKRKINKLKMKKLKNKGLVIA